MADFAQFLQSNSGMSVKPAPLPPGDYQGIIKNWETGDANKNKTPYIRMHLAFTGWPETVGEAQRNQSDGSPIDLGSIQRSRDFFTTPNSLFRLDALLESCGIPTGEGHPYEEALPQLIGAPVLIEVGQRPTQDNKSFVDEIKTVKGLR